MPYPKQPMRFSECHPERKHYARGLCRECYDKRPERLDKIRANQAKWTKLHPEQVKGAWRKTAYGLTNDQFNILIEQQDGRCAICGESFGRPCVDHCHTSKVVRGLLCHACNRGIGDFRDSPEFLRRAANYLELIRQPFVTALEAQPRPGQFILPVLI